MPSVISHYLLAGRMSAYLQQAYPDFQINQNALYWGAQGPDFLYAHPEKEMQELAGSLHRSDPYQTLSYIASFARDTKNDIDKSYALGFLHITHLTAQRTRLSCTARGKLLRQRLALRKTSRTTLSR